MKLLAFDLDGTLLSDTHEILDTTLKSIKTIEERGWHWCIVTGRSFESSQPILNQYQLNCEMILNSGHHWVSKDKTTQSMHPMDPKTLTHVLHLLQAYDYHISIHTDRGKLAFGDLNQYFDEHMAITLKKRQGVMKGLENATLFNKEHFIKNTTSIDTVDDIFKMGAQVLKIDARNFDDLKRDESLVHLNQIPNIQIHSSYEAFLEISDISVNKGITLDAYRKMLGVDLADTYIFGDSLNDLEMFEMFPNSIAMKNSHPAILEKAKWVTASNNEHGISKAIDQYIIKES